MTKIPVKLAAQVTSGLIVFNLVLSFIISYANLVALADANGIHGLLSWLWPTGLDSAMIMSNISLLFFSVYDNRPVERGRGLLGNAGYWVSHALGTPHWYQWALVGFFTALSVGFNIYHAPQTLVGRIMYGLPPAVVFLLMELLIRQLRFMAEMPVEAKKMIANQTEFLDIMKNGNGNRPGGPSDLIGMGIPSSTAYAWWTKWEKILAQELRGDHVPNALER